MQINIYIIYILSCSSLQSIPLKYTDVLGLHIIINVVYYLQNKIQPPNSKTPLEHNSAKPVKPGVKLSLDLRDYGFEDIGGFKYALVSIMPGQQKEKESLSNLGLEPRIFRLGVGRGSHFARPTNL